MLKLLLLFFSRSVCSALCNPMNGNMPGFFVFQNSCSLLKLKSIESVMPSNHLILLPPSPLALNLYQHQGLPSELALCIRWPKYWSFSFSIGPSNEYSGLISFRIDWFGFLQSKELSRVLSNTTVQKNQFFSAQPSLWSNSHIHTRLLERPPVQFSSVAQLCPTLFDPMNRSMLGLPVHIH